jgi:hypothetical protein
MAQNIDFFIDVTNGTLVAAGSVKNGVLPTFTRNDTYNFRVRLQERDTNNFLRDLDTTGASLKLGIGGIDDGPSDGAFKLTINSTTSNAITWSSDEAVVASRIYTAVSNNVSTCGVYGLEPDAYLLTASQPNTAMSFGGSSFTLFPTSSVIISTRRYPASSVQAQQVIKLRRNPAVYSDTFTASSVSGVVALTRTQVGSTTRNEIYNLAIGPDAEGGSVVLAYGTNTTTAIAIGASAASFAEALTSVTGIGANNVSVDSGNNSGDYSISFVRSLGLQAVTTALTLDTSGVVYGSYLGTSVTMATAELDELFAEAGTDTITPTIEIELTQNGTPKTIYQGSISVRRDLITTGAVVPADQASYYTKAEANALFVEDLTTNVDATNRKLVNSYGTAFLDWQNNSIGTGSTILDLSGTAITISDGYNIGIGSTTGTKIGVTSLSKIAFFGNTPISKPTDVNVVSALATLGLFTDNSTTYGVFPRSPRTLSTTASLNFGSVGSNSSTSITIAVTGAAINDIVLLGLPSAISEGLTFFGHVIATDQVHVDAVNATNASKTQSAQTFRISVIGY